MGVLAQDNPIWPSLATRKSFLNSSSRSAFNASAFAALLQSSALNLKDYVWTEQERPLIAHDQFENDEMIPVMDTAAFTFGPDSTMSAAELQKAQRSVASRIAKASREVSIMVCLRMWLSKRKRMHAISWRGSSLKRRIGFCVMAMRVSQWATFVAALEHGSRAIFLESNPCTSPLWLKRWRPLLRKFGKMAIRTSAHGRIQGEYEATEATWTPY